MSASWGGPVRPEGVAPTHPCPGPRCGGEVDVPWHMFMCRRDWYTLPNTFRRAVWSTWQDGRGAGTAAHRAALRAAIDAARNLAAADEARHA